MDLDKGAAQNPETNLWKMGGFLLVSLEKIVNRGGSLYFSLPEWIGQDKSKLFVYH